MIRAALLMAALLAGTPVAAKRAPSYAEDRAEIQELQAEYLFALDWFDADAYAATFTEDGTLDWARGVARGRESIRKEAQQMQAFLASAYGDDGSGKPVRLRHFITNVVIKVDGDRAAGRAYWFESSNNAPGHTVKIGGYGHYEDTLRRVNGKWLFASRKIFNEQLDGRRAEAANPVRTMEQAK